MLLVRDYGLSQVTYCIVVSVGDLQGLHGSDHGAHRHENVLIDDFDEAAFVVVRVARAMDNAHLFDEGALSTLPSTCNRKRRTCLKVQYHGFTLTLIF